MKRNIIFMGFTLITAATGALFYTKIILFLILNCTALKFSRYRTKTSCNLNTFGFILTVGILLCFVLIKE
jgi:uncharacterized membrane protein